MIEIQIFSAIVVHHPCPSSRIVPAHSLSAIVVTFARGFIVAFARSPIVAVALLPRHRLCSLPHHLAGTLFSSCSPA